MAQLRQDYENFTTRNVEILVIGPDKQKDFIEYWEKNKLPFIGLPDPDHKVANLYGQQVKLTRLGRMPAMMLIDKNGYIRFYHYADSMMDIPANKSILNLIDKLNEDGDMAPEKSISIPQ